MDSLLPTTDFDSDRFLKALDKSLAGVGQRRQAGNLSRLKFMFDKPWKEAYEIVHSYIDERVKTALKATSSSTSADKASGYEDSAAKTRYVLLHEMAKEIRDPIELRYQILSVFLPARDTTSILVSNALFHLARSPDIWTELRNSALEVDPNTLTFETLKSMTNFRNVIFETLRLQGPSGRVIRCAQRDTVLPVGGGEDGRSPILVRKGMMVSLNVWCMHHDPDTWGPDVHVFKPERWVGKRPLWEFVPFYGGPRICPANQQVLTHASYALLRLTRQFRHIENRDPVHEYVELTKMTTQSRNGVKIAFLEEQ